MALCLVSFSVGSRYLDAKFQFYKYLSQGGQGLRVPRTVTEICLYTWTLYLQNTPPGVRKKPGEQIITHSKSKTHIHNMRKTTTYH